METSSTKKEHESTSIDSPNSVPEKNDCSTFGQSLIKFMTLATGSVKTALQKPANYKKNINHRRYLQKQLKICTRKKKRGTKAKSVTNTKKKFPETPRMIRTTRELFLSQGNCVPLFATRAENVITEQFIPRQEVISYDTSYPKPVIASYQGFANSVAKQGTAFFVPPVGHDVPSTTLHEGYRDEILPDVFEETGHFMSGEELTRTLDIKDLFVPERLVGNVMNTESIEDQFHAFSTSTFDGNHYGAFQTIPSTANILSW